MSTWSKQRRVMVRVLFVTARHFGSTADLVPDQNPAYFTDGFVPTPVAITIWIEIKNMYSSSSSRLHLPPVN